MAEVKKEKPKYNMWQNTAYMIGLAHRHHRRILYVGLLLACVTSGKVIMDMLIAPIVLSCLEAGSTAGELMKVIGICIGLLLLLTGVRAYIEQNVIFARISLRTKIIEAVSGKNAKTSYSNLLSQEFIELRNKAFDATSSNWEASERIWNVLTVIVTNLISFAVYLFFLSSLNPLIMLAVFATTLIHFLIASKIFEWEYRHKKEKEALSNQISYLYDVAKNREYAKDIRIFGMESWLGEVWNKTVRLYGHFLAKRERTYIWADLLDLFLTLSRNGIAYLYLIW
ncbi:MAG: ABC transporter ATP-binding protein, partial [Bacillota bacterium]|nr:ABC transporter ATP-binding protein [Bacillota bacterium]